DISGMPVVVYAMIAMAIPGAAVGFLAGAMAIVLIGWGYDQRLTRWQGRSVGAFLGGLAGGVLAATVHIQGTLEDLEPAESAVTVVTAALCGLLIATYAQRAIRATRLAAHQTA